MIRTPAHHQTNPAMAAGSFVPGVLATTARMLHPQIGDQYPSNGDGLLSPVAFVGSGGIVMTECDFHRAAQLMETRGGSFLSRLAALYYVADSNNQRNLRATFSGYFIDYHLQNVADALALNNPRFDRQRFLAACGVGS